MTQAKYPEIDTQTQSFNNAFKAYDIRGVVDDALTPGFAYELGHALANMCIQRGVTRVVVGRDGRLSGPRLSEALQDGFLDAGIHVIDVGMVPTPLVYFATYALGTHAGVAITGSHNPPDYNGFKMVVAGEAIYGDDILSLRTLMQGANNQHIATERGHRTEYQIIPDYLKRVVNDIQLTRPLKIAIDCGNGVGGVLASELFKALGCEVTELFCDVDGRFPNHHPDPADPHNLEDLIHCLATTDAEIGLAFDGDADRLGVVTKDGQIIWPDRQLILFARDVLERVPGAQIIYDVKCSRLVTESIKEAGGEPLMWKTGHSLIKAKLRETGAPLAGEMSGHIFFKERWYGFDDGLYAGARLLEIVSKHLDVSACLNGLPQAVSTPELKIPTHEGGQFELVDRLKQQGGFIGAERIVTIDGVRVEYADGFGLARASNTTPVVVLRFEADNETALARIQTIFATQLRALEPTLALPF